MTPRDSVRGSIHLEEVQCVVSEDGNSVMLPATLGQWNAFVEQGSSVEDRRRRLAEVPPQLRAQVESHVRTCWQLRSGK